jgi:hypothetical protein
MLVYPFYYGPCLFEWNYSCSSGVQETLLL